MCFGQAKHTVPASGCLVTRSYILLRYKPQIRLALGSAKSRPAVCTYGFLLEVAVHGPSPVTETALLSEPRPLIHKSTAVYAAVGPQMHGLRRVSLRAGFVLGAGACDGLPAPLQSTNSLKGLQMRL